MKGYQEKRVKTKEDKVAMSQQKKQCKDYQGTVQSLKSIQIKDSNSTQVKALITHPRAYISGFVPSHPLAHTIVAPHTLDKARLTLRVCVCPLSTKLHLATSTCKPQSTECDSLFLQNYLRQIFKRRKQEKKFNLGNIP